jgi:hypothetical protein
MAPSVTVEHPNLSRRLETREDPVPKTNRYRSLSNKCAGTRAGERTDIMSVNRDLSPTMAAGTPYVSSRNVTIQEAVVQLS